MSQIRDRKPRLRFDVYLAQSSSPSITEKSQNFLPNTLHQSETVDISPPPLLTGVDKPIETLTIRKHANAVLSKVQHTQPDAIVATTSSYFFHRLLYFISPPPCACRIAVSARFCAFPPCLHIIPFRESLIHQTLSVITHQTEKKQPFTRRCETLSLSLVYGPYIYILGPYAGYICVGGKARGSLNAHLGYFVNKPRPSARALYSGRGLLGL